MDNTNNQELSAFEEYKDTLYKLAITDEYLMGLPQNSIHLDSENEEIRYAQKLMGNVIVPYAKCNGYIRTHKDSVVPAQKLCEQEKLNEYPNLTYEEFYDRLLLLPIRLVKRVLGELNCTTSIFENLLSLINKQNKIEAIELMRNNNLDIRLLSKKVLFLSIIGSHHIDGQKLQNGEIALEEYTQNIEETFAFNEIGFLMPLVGFDEFLEVSSKFVDATDDAEKEYLRKKLSRLMMSLPDKIIPFICAHWVRKDLYTVFERKVLDDILMRDPDYYAKIKKYYEDNHNLEPLDLPAGIFEKELNEIYNKIERFCPRGQNFAALFGYGELSPIVWTGDWNALSYFLKVLYGGRLENGIITIKQDVPTRMWDKACKLFVDENDKHPSRNIKTRSIASLQKKDFTREINYIFKNVFENIETRKS